MMRHDKFFYTKLRENTSKLKGFVRAVIEECIVIDGNQYIDIPYVMDNMLYADIDHKKNRVSIHLRNGYILTIELKQKTCTIKVDHWYYSVCGEQ